MKTLQSIYYLSILSETQDVYNSKMTSILCSFFYQEMEPTFPTDLIFWLAFTHTTQPEWHYRKSGPRLLSCEPSLFHILITQSKHKRKQNQWTKLGIGSNHVEAFLNLVGEAYFQIFQKDLILAQVSNFISLFLGIHVTSYFTTVTF